MNYIVFDLEFNQGFNSSNPKCPFEIIQIGALKLDNTFKTIETFNELVKPELYHIIHPFVKNLTSITEEDLLYAQSFNHVYKNFVDFIGNSTSVLCIWGMTDIKELLRNIDYHKLKSSLIPKIYIDIQKHASKHLSCPLGTNIGLSNAIELLNIPIETKFHNALNDAFYTTEIFKKIYTEQITPKIYSANKLARISKTKFKLDTNSLYNQFSKMFNRELTSEEKSIIKLSYMMGRTNQFQIEIQNIKID